MTKKKKKPKPKPSRAKLDRAERALELIEKRQAKALAAVDARLREVERQRRELQRKHPQERGEGEERVERERADYERDLQAWRETN